MRDLLQQARRLIAGGLSFPEAAAMLPYTEHTREAITVLYAIDASGRSDKVELLDRAIEQAAQIVRQEEGQS